MEAARVRKFVIDLQGLAIAKASKVPSLAPYPDLPNAHLFGAFCAPRRKQDAESSVRRPPEVPPPAFCWAPHAS